MNNLDFNLIEKLQKFWEDVWNDVNFTIYDVRESNHIYRISSCRKNLALEFNKFFTKNKEKRIPYNILNETVENRKWFLSGFYAAEGNRKNIQKNVSLRNIKVLCQV